VFKAKRRLVVLAATVLAGTALAVVLLTGWASGGNSGVTDVAGSTSAVLYSAGHRPLAPDFTATTLTGSRLSFSSYRGKMVVVNFWGSWCAPCRAEAPALGTLARQLQPDGVRFVGIDIRDEPDSAEAFMQQFDIGYPSLSDPDDEIALDFHSTVPPADIPTTLVIDRSGRIAARIFGESSYAQLKTLIDKVAGTRS
jgi:thiol-disulfide isomerase/thioredoxin